MTHIIDKYFVHRDGGLYFALYHAVDTRDLSEVVVYRHVFPFEVKIWVRPKAEWTPDRFQEVSVAVAHDIMELDRVGTQELIQRRKKARKG